MLEFVRQYIRQHRNSPFIRQAATACEKFLRAYYNEGYYDMTRNGEERVIKIASDQLVNTKSIIFDVGAHKGKWASFVLKHFPNATVYCFEIIPDTAKILKERLLDFPNVNVFNVGLSAKSGEIEVFWNRTNDDTSSIKPPATGKYFVDGEVKKIKCKVETGDALVKQLGVTNIDVLKIDVEGHEVDVLQGFFQTLSVHSSAPKIVQFEYGSTFLAPRHTLQEVYNILEPLGYRIGRIYPGKVEFKAYAIGDEHFRMGNYIAVKYDTKLFELFT